MAETKPRMLSEWTSWSKCATRDGTDAPPWRRSVGVYRNVQRFEGGLVLEAHRLVYHSAKGSKTFLDL